MLIGVGTKGQSPYRESLTHGWTLDADGRAMSKSLGNTIEPQEIIKKSGADLLRLWVASVDFTEDVRLSDTILERLTEAYRKLRNSGFKYMLGNLHDFHPATDAVAGEELLSLDAWILTRAEQLTAQCLAWYAEYAFHKVYRAIYDFVSTDLSAVYFNVLKDRLYTTGRASHGRRSGQTALHRLNSALVRLLAPILSYTCEEVWSHMNAPEPSIHLADFPQASELTAGLTEVQRDDASDWTALLPIRDQVMKALDTARQDKMIGSSLEAAVQLTASGDEAALLKRYADWLPAWFIVSQVELANGPGPLHIAVDRARGDKCERCWKYKADVGSHEEFPTVCADCAGVLPEFLVS